MNETVLAIDLGTSSVKVGLFSTGGDLLHFARESYDLLRPRAGWVEQDPEAWWTAVSRALQQVLHRQNQEHIVAVCAGGQGPTVVLVDSDGHAVRPAISWMDNRASAQSAALAARLSTDRPTYSPIPRLLWVAENEPEVFNRAHRVLGAWDFVGFRLTGGSESAASTMAGDLAWPEGWVAAAGLEGSPLIPGHVDAGTAYGSTGGVWAAQAGLRPGIPVVGGMNDGIGSIVGAAGSVVGRGTDPGGAAGGFALCWNSAVSAPGVDCWPGLTPDTHILGGAFVAGGRAVDWWGGIGLDAGPETVLQRAEQANPGANRLVFLPFLDGERSPIWDAQARGTFLGLTFDHRPEHLSRAVVEGTAYALRLLIEPIAAAGARTDEVRVGGRQARSRFWNQIKADVTGYPLAVPSHPEVALMGDAICAAVGAGAYQDLVHAGEAMVHVSEVLEPDRGNRGLYDHLFGIYRDAYPALRPLFRRLADGTL